MKEQAMNIKDYIYLYINSEAKYRTRYVDSDPGTWSVWHKITPRRLAQLEDASIATVQYSLRRLSDMTEDEKRIAYGFEPGPGIDFNDEGFTWWLHSDGFHYLLKQGFDLFGLIDAGLAVDARTIQPPKVNK